ncbi:MAG: ABC transporter substrate-binding protein [Clostridia bacterium]|nr:ABC transporter substrate-binding protein [Clostridia bacterium]
MKKTWILAAALTLLLAALTGCGARTQESMRVAALKGPTGLGLAYLDGGEGYALEIYDAPDAVTGKFISGELDVACVPVNLASVLYNRLKGGVVLLNVNTLGVLYILENGDSLRSVQDLAGKTIYASGEGSTPEYVLNFILEQNGLRDEVTVEYVGEHAALAAMAAAGEAEIVMLPEPNVSAAQAQNGALRVALDLSEEWIAVTGKPLVQGCTITTKSYYEANREELRRFLEDYAVSVERVLTEEGAAERIEEMQILPSAAIAARAIPNCHIVSVTGEDARAYMQDMLLALYTANPASVGGALPGDDFYADF